MVFYVIAPLNSHPPLAIGGNLPRDHGCVFLEKVPDAKFNCEQRFTLEKLRDTLLPKLVSGEVRVCYEQSVRSRCKTGQ
jgi:hypothetical protein